MADEHAQDPRATPARLEAFRRGDRQVLESVFRAYAPYVHALVRRGLRTSKGNLVHVASEADDAVQEVFVRVLQPKARSAFDPSQTFAAYLSGFARLVVLEMLRQQNRTPLLDDDGWASRRERDWAPTQPLPDTLVERRRRQADLQAFLDQLDEEAKLWVLLRMERGLSQRQVAQQMNTTRHQVRALEEEVLSALRAFWAELPPAPDDEAPAADPPTAPAIVKGES